MRSDHSQADNLFNRLISYTPRVSEGGKSRTALEDFYTEALAWCLRNSDEFRKSFFTLLRKNLVGQTKSQFLLDGQGSIAIDTQLSFDSEDDRDDEDREASSNRRFDLVIRSESNNDFVIVLEDKVRWTFTKGQIPDYLMELKKGMFKDYCTKILVVLSPFGKKPEVPENTIPLMPLKWREVQETLSEISKLKGQRVDRAICGQFAEFLEQKGLALMKIDKLNPRDLNWASFFSFHAASVKILEQFREEQKDVWKPKKIEHGNNDFGGDKNYFFWWGIYSKIPVDNWCGFYFFYLQNPPELVMQVEGVFSKGTNLNRMKPLLTGGVLGKALQQGFYRQRDCPPSSTYFAFYEPINSNYNEKPEAIYDWLASASKEFIDLREKLTQKSKV